ncbi:OLC1v1012647C1 [Oldenlandia corymbosa var. corymbosa]|uniref:OLC1v1012647C1 n=1 Tax=Oldenlandia corymbosa var. corymbosa TaxID=529605 RepID=A0AAV1DWG6_OLDCO|nr:OLC1v1012647C1 [Oldenlandia corymbosa var. corymbosa]
MSNHGKGVKILDDLIDEIDHNEEDNWMDTNGQEFSNYLCGKTFENSLGVVNSMEGTSKLIGGVGYSSNLEEEKHGQRYVPQVDAEEDGTEPTSSIRSMLTIGSWEVIRRNSMENCVETALSVVNKIASQLRESSQFQDVKDDLLLLQVELRLLNTFYMCGRLWGRDVECDYILRQHIEEILQQDTCLTLRAYNHLIEIDLLHKVIFEFRVCIQQVSLRQEVEKMYQILSNDSTHLCSCFEEEIDPLMGIIDLFLDTIHSLVQNINDLDDFPLPFTTFGSSFTSQMSTANVFDNLEDATKKVAIFSHFLRQNTYSPEEVVNLGLTLCSLTIQDGASPLGWSNTIMDIGVKELAMFWGHLILFAICRGLGFRHIESLLTHIRGFILDVSRHIFMYFHDQNPQHVAQIIQRTQPLEPRACEIYVGVLQASKLSLPNKHLALATTHGPDASWRIVFPLLNLLWRLLNGTNCLLDIFQHHMQKIYVGLTFIKVIITTEYPDQFYEKMHALIGHVICEAGIIIIHLCGRGQWRSVKKMESLFLNLEKKLNKLFEAAKEEDTQKLQLPLAPNFPNFIDSLLEKIKSINTDDGDSTIYLAHDELQTLHEDLTFLRSTMIVLPSIQIERSIALQTHIAVVAYELESFIDSFMVRDDCRNYTERLNSIIVEIKLIIAEADGIFEEVPETVAIKSLKTFQSQQINGVAETSRKMPSAGEISTWNDVMVGLDDEVAKITDQLTRGTKELDIVSIVGMPGLGKTTLAKRIHRELSETRYFHVHSWCTLSQVYNKRSLLLQILSGLGIDVDELNSKKDDDDLALELRRRLSGNKYLIILDDVWDTEAWKDLMGSFPNNVNGSRILLTSRHRNVALAIKQDREPHNLRFLNSQESWELLSKKVFFEEECPQELLKLGEAIAHNCNGLPLVIVIVAGVLLSKLELDAWEKVRQSVKTGTLSLVEKCMQTIELSYSHLPQYLKPCFLYFVRFQRNQNVPASELIRLLMAEGFMERNGKDGSKVVLEGYMRELLQRNLIMVGKKGSRGTAKSYVLHDLLYEFCVAKCNEEHFLHHRHEYELGNSIDPSILYRVCLHPRIDGEIVNVKMNYPRLRTLFFVADQNPCNSMGGHCLQKVPEQLKWLMNFIVPDPVSWTPQCWYECVCKLKQSKRLRILDLSAFYIGTLFPVVIESLVHLRYLALRIESSDLEVPSFIASLPNLETFIVHGDGQVRLPDTLWNMKNLKHLCLRGRYAYWVLPNSNPGDCSSLENLETLSTIRVSCEQTTMQVMRKFPNVRRLKCWIDMGTRDAECPILALDFLSQLESLTITHRKGSGDISFEFPRNLKKLSLSGLHMPWSEISAIDKLPNLEVLKLQEDSFSGESWYMEEETFPRLKYLKLAGLDLAWWTDSEDSLPCLQNLELERCHHLEALPTCLADSSTLQTIEVIDCKHVVVAVEEILEQQMDWGNESMISNIQISPPSKLFQLYHAQDLLHGSFFEHRLD